jgi:hypothetical protein
MIGVSKRGPLSVVGLPGLPYTKTATEYILRKMLACAFCRCLIAGVNMLLSDPLTSKDTSFISFEINLDVVRAMD